MSHEFDQALQNFEAVVSDDLKRQYNALLRQFLKFLPRLGKDSFDSKARSLLHTNEQVERHNMVMLALMKTAWLPTHVKTTQPVPQYRSAAAELFVPESGFILCRVKVTVAECGMIGVGDGVADLIAQACKDLLKNIITAMATKAKKYKIRDGKFQYGFNMPVPDPTIYNSEKVYDESQEPSIDVTDDGEMVPKFRSSIEELEKDRAFGYAATRKGRSIVRLNTKLLYETIEANPKLLGLHGMHSVETLKLSMRQDEEIDSQELLQNTD